jgi:hypothetical protein
MIALISEVVFETSKFKTTKEPFGTGTRIAFEVSFPSNDGNALQQHSACFGNYHI